MFWVDADIVFEHVFRENAKGEYGDAGASQGSRRGNECDRRCNMTIAPQQDGEDGTCGSADEFGERDFAEEMTGRSHSRVQNPQGQYVKRTAREPFESVFRMSEFPPLMSHWNLADSITAIVGEDGYQAVELAIDHHVVDDFP